MIHSDAEIPNSLEKPASYLLVFFFLLLTAVGPSFAASGNANEERQLRFGLKIFKAVLAADKDLGSKTNSSGLLDIVLLHASDTKKASKLGGQLLAMGRGEKRGSIRGKLINVMPIHIRNLKSLAQRPAALFILESLNHVDLMQVIDYAKTHRRLLYSPFVGDVERGVMAGLVIETRARPHINRASLVASSVNLRSFFLKAAKVYEP